MKKPWWRSRWMGEPKLLIGVRAICRYARIGPGTFYDWKNHYDFPVAPLPDGRWCTSVTLIDRWIEERRKVAGQGETMEEDGSASLIESNGTQAETADVEPNGNLKGHTNG